MTLVLKGKKRGMTRIFDEKGDAIACSVIEAEPNVVLQIKSVEKDGYSAVQLGFSKKTPKNVSKPLKGHFAKAQVEPRAHILESPIGKGESYEVGQEVGVGYFSQATHVDVTAVSKGKGFQGVIKRHGFAGGPAAHGSGFHRHAGSTGMRSSPGRVFPGLKMAGRMGGDKVTVEGLKVVKVDEERGVILVKGAIPGAKGSVVTIRKAQRKMAKAK